MASAGFRFGAIGSLVASCESYLGPTALRILTYPVAVVDLLKVDYDPRLGSHIGRDRVLLR